MLRYSMYIYTYVLKSLCFQSVMRYFSDGVSLHDGSNKILYFFSKYIMNDERVSIGDVDSLAKVK